MEFDGYNFYIDISCFLHWWNEKQDFKILSNFIWMSSFFMSVSRLLSRDWNPGALSTEILMLEGWGSSHCWWQHNQPFLQVLCLLRGDEDCILIGRKVIFDGQDVLRCSLDYIRMEVLVWTRDLCLCFIHNDFFR